MATGDNSQQFIGRFILTPFPNDLLPMPGFAMLTGTVLFFLAFRAKHFSPQLTHTSAGFIVVKSQYHPPTNDAHIFCNDIGNRYNSHRMNAIPCIGH